MKPAPPDTLEVFLGPGELWFGDAATRIRTLLGSCVAIVLWHPQRQVGGMCHFVLPARMLGQPARRPAYYGDEAMACLLDEARAWQLPPHECRIKLFGAGSMFPDVMAMLQMHGHARLDVLDVARRNEQTARRLVQAHGLHKASEDLGGIGHRSVVFDIWSGDVWVRHAVATHG
ncbi:chemotaxis protein CheD [Viridibacterium curvum]|uniref:Probable chemoreceptor glutamine deamidase CheD n=1 Tax=Viridibacterium curvum TaxID=1101404 RepID=A0ABP9QLZ7_9RHOO